MIDVDAVLEPISEENFSGEDLRYTQVYDDIKEARRADDPLEQGDWQRELKTSDWDLVVKLCEESLKNQTKDLQIAVWLAEGLTRIDGFEGCYSGLKVIIGLLGEYWETLYPEFEEDDLDFRSAPLEFLNNNLPFAIQQVPLTDPKETTGYSLLRWRETKDVGYEENVRDPERRAELIKEGKLEPEVFDTAVVRSPKAFYANLNERIPACREAFQTLDTLVDEKFGRDAPRLSEIGEVLLECERVVTPILKKKREEDPDEPHEVETETPEDETAERPPSEPPAISREVEKPSVSRDVERIGAKPPTVSISRLRDVASSEETVWNQAVQTLSDGGIKKALEILMSAAYSAPSIREKHRYRLLMAKLCLKADRPDLARPIAEQLNALVEELGLDRWESPIWIAEVLDALYQCLTSGEISSDDEYKATELFQKLCTNDVTKAIGYRG